MLVEVLMLVMLRVVVATEKVSLALGASPERKNHGRNLPVIWHADNTLMSVII